MAPALPAVGQCPIGNWYVYQDELCNVVIIPAPTSADADTIAAGLSLTGIYGSLVRRTSLSGGVTQRGERFLPLDQPHPCFDMAGGFSLTPVPGPGYGFYPVTRVLTDAAAALLGNAAARPVQDVTITMSPPAPPAPGRTQLVEYISGGHVVYREATRWGGAIDDSFGNFQSYVLLIDLIEIDPAGRPVQTIGWTLQGGFHGNGGPTYDSAQGIYNPIPPLVSGTVS